MNLPGQFSPSGFRLVQSLSGMSLNGLAGEVRSMTGTETPTGHDLSRYARGLRKPTVWLYEMAQALDAEIPDLCVPEGDDVNRRDLLRLAGTAAVGSTWKQLFGDCDLTNGPTDEILTKHLASLLESHRRLEDVVSGDDLWPVVRAQLDTVSTLLSRSPSAQLFTLGGEHAHWLSWVAMRQGRSGEAKMWLNLSYGWSLDGQCPDLTLWTLRVRSSYDLAEGRKERALKVARAALDVPGVAAASVSIAAHAASMACAALGDRDEALRYADQAHRMAVATAEEQERPAWLYWLSPERGELHRADVAYAVGDYGDAASGFRLADSGLSGFPKDREYYLTRKERALARV